MDDVLCDFIGHYTREKQRYEELILDTKEDRRVYPATDILESGNENCQKLKIKKQWAEYPQSRPGFFLELEPLPGAIEGFSFLDSHPRTEVFIVTAPSVLNAHSYTEKREWVEAHLGLDVAYRLIICPDKSLIKGDYLIDDNRNGKGQEGFSGQMIHFGSKDFPDWDAVVRYFRSEL